MTQTSAQDTDWPRIILHADMDAFYAAVEQLDNPELRGKPVLVGGTGNRSVVSTASYEARPFGVGSAMPMVQAKRRCPQAIVVPPNFPRYKEVSGQIMEVFRNMSPLVEPLSLDEAFVDMTGAQNLFGEPIDMARHLKRHVVEASGGLTISVGVATTKFVAKVASDFQKPDGLTIVRPGEVHDFLWPMDVSKLWGVGPRNLEKLRSLGFRTVGDIAGAREAFLTRRLGTLGTHIFNLARGEDSRMVETEREAKSIGAEFTLEQDIVGAEEIRKHLKRSANRVAKSLRRKGLVAKGVRVKLKTKDFRLLTKQTPVTPPTDSAKTLLTTATALLQQFDLTEPMRLVGLAAFNLAADEDPAQGTLFVDEKNERQRRLEKTLDDLQNRFGTKVVKTGEDLD
ncbi:MAG: DNA polymerase IV [Proteobacteria bacterium]|nr:DNA polymerase IV [Pseudomonadota bacterium]